MPIPFNTQDASQIRITMLIYNVLGDLDDTATASGSELQVSINGDAWVDADGTLENTGSGAYYYQGVLADATTLGLLKVKFAKTGFLTSIAEDSVVDEAQDTALSSAASWSKNQVVAARRRCTLRPISATDGSKAPRSTDFTGFIFIARGQADYVAAAGTIVNKRRALIMADDAIESVDTGADTLTLTGHFYETGDGPFNASGTIGTITSGDDFWVISVDANKIAIAATLADAYSDTRVGLLGSETGTTISDTADTQRGVDGEFMYEATQAETDFDGSEASVAILGHTLYEAFTTVQMVQEGASTWDTVIENGFTAGDLIRGISRTLMANFGKSGNTLTYRDLADSKDSHHGTVTGSGRAAVIDDLT